MPAKKTKKSTSPQVPMRSPCPVACVLDILGDKWTLVVIRDLFMEKKTFGDFQNSWENIPTNILSDRLKRLVEAGIVKKEQYQERPPRYAYHLTEKGQELGPALLELVKWGGKHLDYVEMPFTPEQMAGIFK